jgi:hypothetical protein
MRINVSRLSILNCKLLKEMVGTRRLELLTSTVARKPRTEKERVTQWTWEEPPAATGIVAGFRPWMKQGWTFLDDPIDAELGLTHPSILALRPHLTVARFTTFDKQGGTQLAAVLNLFRKPIG